MFSSPNDFGQTANANNPSVPKPFGSTSSFGSQTGHLVFCGGASTGVFGKAQPSAPFPSTTTFCGLSSPTFGSRSTFGSTSTPAFGSSSSPSFGGSSIFGQKSIGGFELFPTPTNPIGSTNQQSQPSLGSNVFCSSSLFDSSSQSALGATSTPAFGTASSTPSLGATNTSTFGATGNPAFGTTSNPVSGTTSTPAFGSSRTDAFGGSNGNALSSHSFGFQYGGEFGASSTRDYGVSPYRVSPAIGGCCFRTPTFCRPTFGSRAALYTSTTDLHECSLIIQSISAMPDYKNKSHEELRWEDYQSGDKGGRHPAGHFTFSQSNSNPVSTAVATNPSVHKPSSFGFFGPSTGFSYNSSSSAPSILPDPYATMPDISRNPFGSTTAASTPSCSSSSLKHFATTPAVSSNTFASTTSASFSTPSNHGQIQPSTHSTNTSFVDGQLSGSEPTTKPSDEIAQTVYGDQHSGSRAIQYASTSTEQNDGSPLFTNLVVVSISAMPNYEDKSHEELRWEDYQSGDKGGPVPIGQSTGSGGGAFGFGVSIAQPNLQGSSTPGQSSSNPFSIVISANPSALKPSGFGTSGPSVTISFNSSEPAALSTPSNPSFPFQSFNVFFNA